MGVAHTIHLPRFGHLAGHAREVTAHIVGLLNGVNARTWYRATTVGGYLIPFLKEKAKKLKLEVALVCKEVVLSTNTQISVYVNGNSRTFLINKCSFFTRKYSKNCSIHSPYKFKDLQARVSHKCRF